jgi:hypothetical protein
MTCVNQLLLAQRFGSPAADLNKTRLRKTTFSTLWAAADRAEGGQVELVLGVFSSFCIYSF